MGGNLTDTSRVKGAAITVEGREEGKELLKAKALKEEEGAALLRREMASMYPLQLRYHNT